MTIFLAALVASTSLQITVWPEGANGPKHQWTLRCAPAAGTLPHRAAACRKLARLQHPFRETPPRTACTDIYGGPQTAHVTGRLRGARVDARFDRRDGCAIGRWNGVQFLFPGANDRR